MSTSAKILVAVAKAFDKIGRSNSTRFPEGNVRPIDAVTNEEIDAYFKKEQAAYEFAIAGELRSAANRRFDVAKVGLKDVGILDNLEAIAPGASGVLFSGSIASVSAQVKRASDRVNVKQFCTELRKLGVNQEVIDKALSKATTSGTPAKVIRSDLNI